MRTRSFFIAANIIFLSTLFTGCSKPQQEETTSQSTPTKNVTKKAVPQKAAKSILEYELFADTQRQAPAEGVIEFETNTDHFADYAHARRFLKMPKDEVATINEEGVLEFPEGSIIAQTFSYFKDSRDPSMGEKIIETRLLIRHEEDWEPVPYIWNDDITDARRSVAGGIIEVNWIHNDGENRSLKYLVPNSNECKRCHENNMDYTFPIGLTIASLNKDIETPSGIQNQLNYLESKNVIEQAPENIDQAPRLAQWDDPASGTVRERARAWIHVNCAHCHNPNGHGSVSGLDLSFDQTDPVRFGVFKPPVAAGHGSEGLRYSIHPGKPDESFLIRRLLSNDPSVMMPPTGRRTSSTEAIELLRTWIAEMNIDDDEAQRIITLQEENLKKMVESGEWVDE